MPHVVGDARAQMATAAINDLPVEVRNLIERLETPPKGAGG